MNAAFCLRALGRADEAYEMYAELLDGFASRLRAEQIAAIERTMAELEKQLGRLTISTDLDAKILVDGRDRGVAPLGAPIRVRPGRHAILIVKEGYRVFDKTVEVGAAMVLVVDAKLEPLGPASQPAPTARFASDHLFAEAFLGYVGGSFASDAEQGCAGACAPANGVFAGVRGGYRFKMGLGVELDFGYLYIAQSVARSKAWPKTTPPVTYSLRDDVRFHGSLFGLGLSQRIPITGPFGAVLRTTVGVISAHSSDAIDGTVPGNGSALAVVVTERGQVLSSQPGVVIPELGAEIARGPLRIGLGLAVVIGLTQGPRYTHSQIGLKDPMCAPSPGMPNDDPGCLPNTSAVASDLAYRPFVLWAPQLSLSYAF
jgi:hypothetical protein